MLDYRIIFEKHGALKPSSGLMKNEVWLDVGNSLGMGLFDHHQLEGCQSAFSALFNHLDFLINLKESAQRQEPIIVHLHEEPDLDCVASYYALRFYLEHNEPERSKFFGENGKGKILEKYINDIDAGKNKITDYPTLYAIFSCLDEGREKSEETDHYVVNRGLELISTALELSELTETKLIDYDFSDCLADAFANEIRLVNDSSSYEEEKKNNEISFEQISIWTKEGNIKHVPAAIWKHRPRSNNGYSYARKEGNVITIIPYAIKGENNSDTTRVFASVNPDIDKEKAYSLRPIAEIIEQMEQIEEQRLFEQEGTYRRDHSRPREAAGHLGKMPFAATSDPWFVKPEEDLFDSPRIQSILSYEDILEVIRNNGSAVKKSFVAELKETPTLLYEKQMIPLSDWQDEIKQLLNKASSHVVVWGELDASLIRHNNRLLEAYCLNLIGKPLHELREKSMHFVDYRTCIYSDINCTVILTATYDGYDAATLALSGMLDTTNSESFITSKLIKDISAIVRQRNTLLEYEDEIGEIKPKKHRNIEDLNDRMLALSIQMQKDDLIEDVIERGIYSFIKTNFGISELKTSVMDEIGILVGESRDKLISKFNILSAFAVPFVLIATIFQMGFLKFDAVLNLTGCAACAGWVVVFLSIALLIVLISNSALVKALVIRLKTHKVVK